MADAWRNSQRERRRRFEIARICTVTAVSAVETHGPRAAFDRISLRRLILIRWVAVAGQAVALLVVHYGFDFELPLLASLGVVACSVLVNLVFTIYRRAATRLEEREAAFYLGYDLLQLAVLLFLTGGLQNPFAILILAPVTVAATILSRRPVIALYLLFVDRPSSGPTDAGA